MIYHLSNTELTVSVSDLGAELTSICGKDGTEYLWQGDPAYWGGQSPWLFPICGRLWEGRYTFRGKNYEMNLHGFARKTVFSVAEHTDTSLTMALSESPETLAQYPFPFTLTVTYRLEGNALLAKAEIKNTGSEIMPASFGFHPGFRVPLGKGGFEDWRLVFGKACHPKKILLSPACFVTDEREPLPLTEDRVLPLCHGLFDNDAIFVEDMADRITLESDKDPHRVTVCYHGAPYLGFWHTPHTEAPFVCIEPWYGLPSTHGIVDDFETKANCFRLSPGQTKECLFDLILS